MRKLIIAFWVFIVCMLLWQCYSSDQARKQKEKEHPQQIQFIFLPNAPHATPTPAPRQGADVQQIHYSMAYDTPSTGNSTCYVTLKNLGNAKATGIQILVRPFRGASNYDEDVGQNPADMAPLSEDDPISKFGQWLTFPDLAPGESNTQSMVFLSRRFVIPGTNPKPEILFQTVKTNP